jgi:HPt (histidine-containing phosphotransfer) domain-containing protein
MIDWEQLDAIADGWPEDFVEIYDGFVADSPNDLNALAEAIQAGDIPRVASLAHRAKGSAANFGFQGVSLAAGEIESLARSGLLDGAPEFLTQAIHALETGIREVAIARARTA